MRRSQGLKQDVQCSLTDPIICPRDARECVVVMNVSNSYPEWVSINPCLLRWTSDTWHQVKTLQIKTRDDYVDVNEDRQVHLKSGAQSASELYDGVDPDDFFLESKQRKSAHCSAVGTGHYNTFDGKYWHFYDGNSKTPTRLTLYRSTKRDFAIQVQVRGNPAIACAIAGREGRNWVQVNGCGGAVSLKEDCPDQLEVSPPPAPAVGATLQEEVGCAARQPASCVRLSPPRRADPLARVRDLNNRATRRTART